MLPGFLGIGTNPSARRAQSQPAKLYPLFSSTKSVVLRLLETLIITGGAKNSFTRTNTSYCLPAISFQLGQHCEASIGRVEHKRKGLLCQAHILSNSETKYSFPLIGRKILLIKKPRFAFRNSLNL